MPIHQLASLVFIGLMVYVGYRVLYSSLSKVTKWTLATLSLILVVRYGLPVLSGMQLDQKIIAFAKWISSVSTNSISKSSQDF